MTTPNGELPAVFVTHAADILGDTSKGLSGPQIVKLTAAYAVDWNVTIPHGTYPFTKLGINKRTALAENWSSQDLVDTPSPRLLSRFELLGTHAA